MLSIALLKRESPYFNEGRKSILLHVFQPQKSPPCVPKKRREKVAKKYISLLETIRKQRKEVITLPYFEKLKGTRSMDLYCLRLVKKSPNIRIIFTFIGSYVVLLTAFEEREESDYKGLLRAQ